jgi:hypothetical protein
MGILRRRKEGDADPKRRRKLALTFSIFAVSVGVTFTWFAKDKETGERPKSEKEILITRPGDSLPSGVSPDTLFHFER